MGRGWWVVVLIRHAREHKFVLTNRVRTVRRTREDEDRERHRKCLRGAASTETVRARAPGPVAERSCSTLSRRHVAWRRGVVAVAVRSGATEASGHPSPIAIQGGHSDSHDSTRHRVDCPRSSTKPTPEVERQRKPVAQQRSSRDQSDVSLRSPQRPPRRGKLPRTLSLLRRLCVSSQVIQRGTRATVADTHATEGT